MTHISFLKMHGTGNDFVIIDNRDGELTLTAKQAALLSDRHFGIGCDQLVLMEKSAKSDVFMRIYNQDGSESSACGNATRCVGWLILRETSREVIAVETRAARLTVERIDEMSVRVDMGEPKSEWKDIPLAESRNTEHLGIAEGALTDPVAVNMGNPHMVFFVADMAFIDLARDGAILEHHPLYPERCNVSAAQILSREAMKLKVWERGTGLTLACGTAACASVVAGVRRKLIDRKVTVELPGGELLVEWDAASNHVHLTGAVALVFEGAFDRGLLL